MLYCTALRDMGRAHRWDGAKPSGERDGAVLQGRRATDRRTIAAISRRQERLPPFCEIICLHSARLFASIRGTAKQNIDIGPDFHVALMPKTLKRWVSSVFRIDACRSFHRQWVTFSMCLCLCKRIIQVFRYYLAIFAMGRTVFMGVQMVGEDGHWEESHQA